MKQSTALTILKTGKNVFLTGQAGAGKTYLLNEYIRYLRARNIEVAVTASTGIAATHMNGMTIHSWSGMGIKDSFDATDFTRLKSRQSVCERIVSSKVLIVDEISMLHANQVDLLNEILKVIRKNDLPFGGMQVIFSGDFFQLPPVGKKGESNKEKFAFMAKSWVAAELLVCYLTEQHRQDAQDESARFGMSLNDILNQIRAQQVSSDAINILKSAQHHSIDINRIRLYTHNINVDHINETELAKLDGKSHWYEGNTFGDKILVDNLKRSVRVSENLHLKIGAKVMFVKNNPNNAVFNGTMGEIMDFVSPNDSVSLSNAQQLYPLVRLNSGREVLAEPEEWIVEDKDGLVIASYTQIPLCLAWAITIHKSQGMTLEAAEIDLSRTFEAGQGYVALSRLRSLDGLKLLGFNQKSLLLDEWVFRVDKRFWEIAAEQEAEFLMLDNNTLDKLHLDFVIACQGITSKETVYQNEMRLLEQKKQDEGREYRRDNDPAFIKIDDKNLVRKSQLSQTLQETKALLDKGLGIDEIAHKRSLAISTIIRHIDELYRKNSEFDYAHIRPSNQIIADVQVAYDAIESQGGFDEGVLLSPIVEECGGRYGYNEVRLALIFIDKSGTKELGDA
ncbi:MULTISPECIES: AAA family ATPase [unclassified Moraxella]|uniref:AAA family ATPase n=1 Tax=unclassified Moraxella TaxID=2685852 RepID=UPI00359E4DB8